MASAGCQLVARRRRGPNCAQGGFITYWRSWNTPLSGTSTLSRFECLINSNTKSSSVQKFSLRGSTILHFPVCNFTMRCASPSCRARRRGSWKPHAPPLPAHVVIMLHFFRALLSVFSSRFPPSPASYHIVRGLVPQESPSPPRSGHSCPDSR